MSELTAETIIRRVAVALDASAQNSQALQAAAELAASLQAELEGIFIEDINLIRLTELPFIREIRPASMTEEPFNIQRMEQELRSLARQQQQKLELVAREKGISCSFSIRRGHIRAEMMEVVTEVDVLTLCGPGRVSEIFSRQPAAFTLRADTTARQQARSAVSVVFGNARNEKRALMAAASLAKRLDTNINVLITAGSDAETDELQREAETILESQTQPVNYSRLIGNQLSDLVLATISSNSQVLLVNSNNTLITGEQLWHCLEQVSCPVLIVREQIAGN
jgi:nucleotide-binding universal stress UspA family protein